MEYICSNYYYAKRVREQERHEREQQEPEKSDEDSLYNHDDCSDEQLLEFGVPETVDEGDRSVIEIRLCILKVEKENMSADDFKDYTGEWDSKHLAWFLARVGMATAKIPKYSVALKK